MVGSKPFSKINPRSNIDLAVINSLCCYYETKIEAQKLLAQHNYSADRRGVFSTLVQVDNTNEEGETVTQDKRQRDRQKEKKSETVRDQSLRHKGRERERQFGRK